MTGSRRGISVPGPRSSASASRRAGTETSVRAFGGDDHAQERDSSKGINHATVEQDRLDCPLPYGHDIRLNSARLSYRP